MKKEVERKIEEIYESILKYIKENKIRKLASLYSGDLGLLLFLNYYSKYAQNEKIDFFTEEYCENILDEIILDKTFYTFSNGLTGLLYLVQFLKKNNLIIIDLTEVKDDLEICIINEMKNDFKYKYYDLLHGPMGVGYYFLKNNKKENILINIVDFLYEIAEKDYENKSFKWKSILNEKNEIGYNISLSHGISSIILFLSYLLKNKLKSDKIIEMLKYSTNYVLSQQIDYLTYGSYFPTYSLDYTKPITKSRLAWCYGDLGIAYSIWNAGKTLNHREWEELGLKILIKSTERKGTIENNVMDAGICHGCIGISMIYGRLYIETKNITFQIARDHWIKQSLLFAKYNDGVGGYKTYSKGEYINDYYLLTGISGIGLMYLSYLMNDLQRWDEIFFL
jgi:hypothetical protein